MNLNKLIMKLLEYYFPHKEENRELKEKVVSLTKENKDLRDGWNFASKNHLHLYEEIRILKDELRSC